MIVSPFKVWVGCTSLAIWIPALFTHPFFCPLHVNFYDLVQGENALGVEDTYTDCPCRRKARLEGHTSFHPTTSKDLTEGKPKPTVDLSSTHISVSSYCFSILLLAYCCWHTLHTVTGILYSDCQYLFDPSPSDSPFFLCIFHFELHVKLLTAVRMLVC